MAIVVSHLHFSIPSFKSNSTVLMAETFIATIGVTLFFFLFLSGYSLFFKRPRFSTLGDLWTYLRKGLLRIYPLYWLALVFTMLMHSYGITSGWLSDMDVGQPVLTVLGVQILLSSSFTLVPFWFVSAIVIFYLLFPIIIFATSKIQRPFTFSASAVSLVIFVLMLAMSALTDEIDERLLIYYWPQRCLSPSPRSFRHRSETRSHRYCRHTFPISSPWS